MVGGAPSEIVANHSGYPKPAAFSHSNPIDSSIKGGFVIFQPSSALFQDMQDIFHKFADKGDEHIQGFIDKYFQNRTGGFEYIDDTGVFMDNFNKNGPVPRDRLKGIHFFVSSST